MKFIFWLSFLFISYLAQPLQAQTPTSNKFLVPTAFSPNGDGHNDFLVFNTKNVSSFNFKIFNRWGEVVFETENLSRFWDGNAKGSLTNAVVYTYIAKGVYSDNEKFLLKGNITVLR
jgi:gliding motility-associated-like protein